MKNVPSTYVHFGVDNSETGQVGSEPSQLQAGAGVALSQAPSMGTQNPA